MKPSELALLVSSKSHLLNLNLQLLVLPTAGPNIIFILLQGEDHHFQPWLVSDMKITVDA